MRNIVVLMLMMLVLAPSWSEELWVRSRRFQGMQIGRRDDLYVELSEFCKALDVPWTRQGSVITIAPTDPESPSDSSPASSLSEVRAGGQVLPFQIGPEGQVLVQLKSTAAALGATVSRNPSLNTVDVTLTPAARKSLGAAPSASPEPVKPAGERGTPSEPRTDAPRPSYSTKTSLVAARDPKSGLYGFKRSEQGGDWVIRPQFYQAQSFQFGLASVCVVASSATKNRYEIQSWDSHASQREKFEKLSVEDQKRYRAASYKTYQSGKFGFINEAGEWVIAPTYLFADSFQKNERTGQICARVSAGSDRRFRYIDRLGRPVEPEHP